MTETSQHPDVPGCIVRLTEPALGDLRDLFKADPQIVRWAIKKMIQIERNPQAGEPLLGGLIGYRKITVGDRDWRIVWRVTQDEFGNRIVDIAEVWAVGYRKDSEVYQEIRQRIANADESPRTSALTEVLELFQKQARGLTATPEPLSDEHNIPTWLYEALLYVAKLPDAQIKHMSLDEAEAAWTRHISGAQ